MADRLLLATGDELLLSSTDRLLLTGTAVTVDLSGQGTAASGSTADLLLAADLAGHDDTAAGANGQLDLAADLQGSGHAATTGQAQLDLAADLAGSGHAASGATGQFDLSATLAGSGHSASGTNADLLLAADLSGHGDAASGTTGALEVISVGQVDLAGSGHAASAGTAELLLEADLAGSGDAASGGSGTLSLEGEPVVVVEAPSGWERMPPRRRPERTHRLRVVVLFAATCTVELEVERRATFVAVATAQIVQVLSGLRSGVRCVRRSKVHPMVLRSRSGFCPSGTATDVRWSQERREAHNARALALVAFLND